MPPCFGENMKHFIIWLLTIIVLLCQTAPSHGDTFEDRASVVLSLIEKKLPITDCIHRAEENANKFSLTGDTHYAVLWINMYSLNCILDWKLNDLPFKLNEELRCKYFNQSDPEILSLFLSVSSVIDEALKFLKPRQFKQLFRGVQIDWPFVNRTLVVEDGFFSSSTDIDVALQYAQGQILLVIQELNGVDISNYMDENYKNLKEVLGTSGKLFKIERKVTDDREINDLMSDLKVSWKYHSNNPKMVLFMREISASQQEKDNVLNEQKHLLEEICHLTEQTSILSMIESVVRKLGTIVWLVVTCIYRILATIGWICVGILVSLLVLGPLIIVLILFICLCLVITVSIANPA